MNRKLPSLVWLRAFREAVKHRQFKAAAERLNVSPSTISSEIRALEEHLGVSLFERKAQGLVPTDLALQWFIQVDGAFTSLEASMSVFDEPAKELTIGALPFVTNEFLIPLLSQMQNEGGDGGSGLALNFGSEIRLDTLYRLGAAKPNCGSDAVIRYQKAPDPKSSADENLVWHNLGKAELAAVQANGIKVPQRRIALQSNFDGWRFFESLAKELKQKNVLSFDNYPAVISAISQGLGVGLIVLPLSNRYLKHETLIELSYPRVSLEEEYWFVFDAAHPSADQLRSFSEALKNFLASGI